MEKEANDLIQFVLALIEVVILVICGISYTERRRNE